MKTAIKTTLALAAASLALCASAQVTFFEQHNFEGQAVTVDKPMADLGGFSFSDADVSVVVAGGAWELCEGAQYSGRCVVLRPGSYGSIGAIGLRRGILSARALHADPRVADPRRPPVVVPTPHPLPHVTPIGTRVTLYEHDGYRGQSVTIDRPIADLDRVGFNDRASSVEVVGEPWQLCEDVRFGARCVVLQVGRHPSLGSMGLNDRVSSVRVAGRDVHAGEDPRYPSAPVVSYVTFFEHDAFEGQSFTADRRIGSFGRYGFNNRASSVVVVGERWEVCDEPQFGGRCLILRPGNYGSLRSMGMNDRLSSARPVNRETRFDDDRYAPTPTHIGPDYRRRQDERLYEVNVSSVRAVVGSPEQRCWIEREQVVQDSGNANVPGAIVGAIIGGILGHQIGGGTGKDVATVGGAVAGAAIGANAGRDSGDDHASFHEVRRCEQWSGQARTQYWDVTYYFRGVEHRVQMTSPPGRTITVNERGEPRV